MKRLFLFAFILGTIGAFGYSYWKIGKVSIVNKSNKKKPTFSIETPPKNSIKGTIESLSGTVKWESRTATQAAEITKPVTISQGESLETGEDGNVTIIFPEIASISLSSQSKISISQTLPANFVFDQKEGSASYEKTGEIPISIRAFHLLTTLNTGKLTLTVDKENAEISIDVKKGSATVAFNNLENVSTVIDIEEGEKFTYNDDSRATSTK